MSTFRSGWDDAQSGQSFAYSLRPVASIEERINYRCGFTANRAERGIETLPALMHEVHRGGNRYYWLVAVEASKPVYNVTCGGRPDGKAGYHDLAALMRLKGDCT
jgi:hypothetical protein